MMVASVVPSTWKLRAERLRRAGALEVELDDGVDGRLGGKAGLRHLADEQLRGLGGLVLVREGEELAEYLA